ncbi:LysR family transcriptional regulator [Gulosibacter sp. 10]|uniref:LysR family transcriptional regulator n=1 Tax=Gulosibacter sp. 10 TaxID=1255570 RepID=UPI000B35731C|nr:LysR family transcriptional regulator [Gulosibacter sp. 10]
MELHQLRYFLAVVDEGSFTAAAGRMRVSQSGISTQVQKLERELGLALIDRSARRIALTPAGERLVPSARKALAAVAEVTSTADDIRGLVTGSLRVATVTGMAWPPLFDALAAVHEAHPGIDLRLHEGNSADILDEVAAGIADIAVAAWSGPPPDGLEHAVVFDDPLAAVAHPEHPVARAEGVEPRELAALDLIALPRGTGARTALDELLARAGAAGEVRWEVSSPAYLRMLAARGMGVGIVSATTARGWRDVAVLPVLDEGIRSRLGVVWRRHPAPAARALLHRLI